MMKQEIDKNNFIALIQKKEFDKNRFVDKILTDRVCRNLSVDNMMEHPQIMVYYHCYEVLKEATKTESGKFENYKDRFAALLRHGNSYHRNFGLSLLSNLTSGSKKMDFHEFSQDYFACLNDIKMMTAECCLKNLKQIIKSRKEYTGVITEEVMQADNFLRYKKKQQELIYSFVIELLEEAFENGFCRDQIFEYVSGKRESISPKTKKMANQLHKRLAV